ncbi:MAG TPA: YpdA family putative bacillithiol disulfide reductase [Flavisolibacter sp.]|nr:YpdA family putative bacillithiol disulfide reductase [Flavisolibacter sp.]
MKYTLIIVGGGPIGIACALEAKKHNIDYLVLERGTLVNSLYNYPVNMTFFSTSERLEIGAVPFVSNNPKPTRSESLEYYRRVTLDNKVNIHLFEEVKDINKSNNNESKSLLYEVITNKNTYQANHIIIATGFYDIPYLLNVPGENLPKVKHYYRDPHFYAFQKVMVVGAMNSAVDAALETWRKGAEVTMVIRGNEIGKRVKYWVRPDIENRIKEGSIKAYFQSVVLAIKEDEVDIQTPDGVKTIPNDWLLALTGYQPDLPFLKKIGIDLCKDETCKPNYSEENHESNQKNIYLAGVICGGMDTHRLFIENSREHAVKIIGHIAKESFNGEVHH